MLSYSNTATPPRVPRLVGKTNSPIRKEIVEWQRNKQAKESVLWGLVNLVLLAVLLGDIVAGYDKCNKYHKYFYYTECFFSVVFFLNVSFHLYKFCTLGKNESKQKPKPNISFNTSANVSLNGMNTSANISLNGLNRTPYQNVISNNLCKTPINSTMTNWLGNTASNQSLNSTPMTPREPNSPSFKSSPILPANLTNMALEDEQSLNHYLKQYETVESSHNNAVAIESTTNLLSYFWNQPNKQIKDNSPMLHRCQYQLSTPSPTHSSSPKTDDKTSPLNQSNCVDTWKRLNVDSVALMQWTENLRIWISQTILCRLINEIKAIDKSLHGQGLVDVSIGQVGIDRLRKTAQGQILQSTPNLPTILPFLELHTNQEYLIRRIRELARGGCMSEYKWNGGTSFNGKEWDHTLPTDSAIVMHLVAAYLDTQLVPLPNNPDIRPFTGFHFIKSTEKLPEPKTSTLAIHEVSVNPPHYRVIIGAETYEMVKGYNNLFHSILLFLYQVNVREHGMLGRVNLGRSGLNMLWIINAS